MAGIFRNVFTVGAFTALSRVLGLGREMLQSRLIGAGVEQSAFTLAFALPNMMRKLFGEGALTAAFVPVFKAEVACEGMEKAARLARAVMTSVFLALAAILALAFGALGLWVRIAELGPRGEIAATLIATLLPYMLFICGAAFGMGVLNALGRFKASSFMPALLNILWIAALAMLLFFPSLTPRERVEAVAVTKEDAEDASFYYKNSVIPKMSALRAAVDAMETLVAREAWPMPTYGDIIFKI